MQTSVMMWPAVRSSPDGAAAEGNDGQRLAEGMRVLERRLFLAVFADPDLLNRDLPPRTDVIERRVARHPQDPSGERDLPFLVLLNGPHQLHGALLSH